MTAPSSRGSLRLSHDRTREAGAGLLVPATITDPPIEPLLTAGDVACILGVRPKRVYELGIPAVRLSQKTLRWRRSAVQAWLDQRTEGGAA